jgi:hypothetical protein
MNGLKFPYESEADYCGPCRVGIFAELKEEESTSSQPVFYNPIVTTHIEAKSTLSSTLVMSSTSAANVANKMSYGVGTEKRKQSATEKQSVRTDTDFGERLRASMASRNEALQQSEITVQTEAALADHRGRFHSGNAATLQASTLAPKSKGSMAPPISGHQGSVQVAKQLQGIAAQGKGNAPTQVTTKKTVEKSSSSSDEETPLSTALPPRPKMVLKQEPIPKKARRESELEELLTDQERKNEADKVMLWRKLQAEIAKSDKIADE